MKWSDIEIRLRDLEGPHLEFKESPFLNDTSEIAAQLISFANRYGGKIFVGVRDDGTSIVRDRKGRDSGCHGWLRWVDIIVAFNCLSLSFSLSLLLVGVTLSAIPQQGQNTP
jgi:hypothetical protein